MRLGDRCPNCSGILRCKFTETMGASRIRHLRCSSCSVKDREVVALDERGRVVSNYLADKVLEETASWPNIPNF